MNGGASQDKGKVPEAMLTHCYAHKLNLVFLQSAKCTLVCKAFFKTLERLTAFFSKSTKTTRLLDDVVKHRLPRALATSWSSNSRMLQTVSIHHADILTAFGAIDDDEDNWDNGPTMKSTGF